MLWTKDQERMPGNKCLEVKALEINAKEMMAGNRHYEPMMTRSQILYTPIPYPNPK